MTAHTAQPTPDHGPQRQELVVRPLRRQDPEFVTNDATDRLVSQIEEEDRNASRIPTTPIIGPRGQHMTVTDAADEVQRITTIISLGEDQVDEHRNSLRHRRVPPWMKIATLIGVVVIDYPLMLWVASSVFNVNWADPWGLPLLISIVVATIATGLAAFTLHHLGREHREHKNDKGQLVWKTLSTGSRVTLIVVALLITAIAVVSFERVYSEGISSGLTGLALGLAALVAFVMMISAWLTWRNAFKDGSVLVDDLMHYSKIVKRYTEIQRDHEDKAAKLRYQLAVIQRRAQRDRNATTAF